MPSLFKATSWFVFLAIQLTIQGVIVSPVIHYTVTPILSLYLLQNYLGYHRTCLVGDKAYRLEMSLFVGEDIETMTDDNFVPQGRLTV